MYDSMPRARCSKWAPLRASALRAHAVNPAAHPTVADFWHRRDMSVYHRKVVIDMGDVKRIRVLGWDVLIYGIEY